MKVKIKRIDKSLPLPKYETPGSVAFDFVVRETMIIGPKGIGRLPGNVVVEVPEGYMLFVKDRSSTIKKKGLLITAGFIDQDYCGDGDEILLQFYNPTDAPVTVERGERVAQGVFLPVLKPDWEEVEAMNKYNRGGFGSTDSPPAAMTKGKLIVLYGINNLGKTTQAKLLVDKIKSAGRTAEYVKVHIYDQAPDGPMISDYLRSGNPYGLTPREFQLLAAVNKYHYQASLKEKLDQGRIVIAEDYWATSVAWGAGAGVDKEFLVKLNEGLIKEDLAFLFDGERFLDSTEPGHRHEVDMDLTNRVRQVHLELGQEYGWKKINANDTIVNIHTLIWEEVRKII